MSNIFWTILKKNIRTAEININWRIDNWKHRGNYGKWWIEDDNFYRESSSKKEATKTSIILNTLLLISEKKIISCQKFTMLKKIWDGTQDDINLKN